MLPTYAAEHLRGGVHSPRVYADGHEVEVDIWAVGNLILDARRFGSALSAAMISLGTFHP